MSADMINTEGDAMDDQFWNLFRETGEPMGYLLYRAGKKSKQKKEADKAGQTPKEGAPPASA